MHNGRMQIRFTRRARRHKIGVAHAMHAMFSTEPQYVDGPRDMYLEWVADDDRGVRLHIIAVVLEEEQELLVIHVMPDYRGSL